MMSEDKFAEAAAAEAGSTQGKLRSAHTPLHSGVERLAAGSEFDLIRRFFEGTAASSDERVRLGAGDDCAVVDGNGIALSSDMSVEGVHFRREWLSPGEIGYRAAAAALSDLAAMAARPIGVLVSVAAPEADAGEALVELMAGVRQACESVGGTVLGGDLTRSPGPLVVDVTVVGESARPVLRSGARRADEVWVTGELGGAAAALHWLQRGDEVPPGARERFARPVPRIREAIWLRDRVAVHAMLDLSDGLSGDAAQLAAASGVAVLLAAELIPVHPAVQQIASEREEVLRIAVGGGEDYELCFAAPAGTVYPFVAEFADYFGVRLTCVGRVGGGTGVWWSDAEGNRRPLAVDGYQHFRDRR